MPRYVGLTLEGLGDNLIPRQRFHGVPWALYATNASQVNDFNHRSLQPRRSVSGPARVAGLTVNGNATVSGSAVAPVTHHGWQYLEQAMSSDRPDTWYSFSIVSDQSGRVLHQWCPV
jgi:hypothetical protein